ncbi:enoyl-CoA hydratase-related protein [Rhodococcus sp. NPDC003382]|uniref:enoyl-CoA hydratase-related protein n=1 Tax=Rhodococcus sp. HM1 TaxID=2937759 RepID=UPI00200B0384|nr:enoyl-CoA hydratase-related protein [Rhodococcus sp. HM1]MCK8669752.1 enoyl-CoA hydratase-related protein [Rhodococcus sp. HM1]
MAHDINSADRPSDEEAPLLVTKDGAVVVLTLNRPDRRNALNRAMRKALKKELWRADGDDDVRVVVITGAGTSFSSGVDLPEALSGPPPRTEGVTPTQVIRGTSKPVIAAVNGPCYTGGYELAVNCSFIIASERAEFADTHAQIGLLNGWGGSAMLPRMIGLPAAIQFILSGEPIDGATAARIGLANEVVPHEDLMTRTLDIAGRIAAGHPGAVQRMLRLLKEGAGTSLSHALGLEAEASVTYRSDGADVGARFSKRRAEKN